MNLVDHNIVNLWSCVTPESHRVQNVINCIHQIITSGFDFPSLILTECLINVKLLIFRQKYIMRKIQINFLRQVLTAINVRKCWTLNSRIYFCPYKLRSNISWRIKSSVDIWPEMSTKEIKVNFKRHKIFFLFLSKLFGKLLFLFISF